MSRCWSRRCGAWTYHRYRNVPVDESLWVLMGRIIEVPVGPDNEGAMLLIEVDELDEDEIFGIRGGPAVERAQNTLEGAIDRLRPTLDTLVAKLEALPRRPDSLSVQFGVKFTASALPILVSASSEAQLQLTLTWTSVVPAPVHGG
jgi:hypothetical protein